MTDPGTRPQRSALVLTALVLGALVCNINLSVANVALPDIARNFDASQTMTNAVAIATTLGLAMSVLWFGATGDRYGRKGILMLGLGLTVPFSLLSAFAPSVGILVIARVGTGLAGGMSFPTTLALIAALWSEGPGRTRAIAVWSGVGGSAAVLGAVIAGMLLSEFWWGSVFLVAVLPAVVALALVVAFVPAHVEESSAKVDHLGGALSMVMIGCLVIGINFLPSRGYARFSLVMIGVAVVLVGLFALRQLRVANPLYDLRVAQRRLFWVAGVGGLIVFGALMGTMFVGQQFLQDVLGYSTFEAGSAVVPAAVGMIISAPTSARLVLARGSRLTMLVGYGFVILALADMAFVWSAGMAYWPVGLAYLLIGLGAGIVLTPASRAITASTPVRRIGMGSATTDLQRDLGGAIMQSLLGAILTAAYAREFSSLLGSAGTKVSAKAEAALTSSYASAAVAAERYPRYADQIMTAARRSFDQGGRWAFAAGLGVVVLGFGLMLACFPGADREDDLRAAYARADAEPGSEPVTG